MRRILRTCLPAPPSKPQAAADQSQWAPARGAARARCIFNALFLEFVWYLPTPSLVIV